MDPEHPDAAVEAENRYCTCEEDINNMRCVESGHCGQIRGQEIIRLGDEINIGHEDGHYRNQEVD